MAASTGLAAANLKLPATMAQGFKNKLEKKARSSASQNKGKGLTKKGGRAIPPKKAAAVHAEIKKKSGSGAHGDHFESLAAAKAAQKGKLSSMMKEVAQRGEAMPADQKAKGR